MKKGNKIFWITLSSDIELPTPYTLFKFMEDIEAWDPDKFFKPKLFDELPFPDETLSVIGARTSRGKTTSLLNLAIEAIESGRRCIFITLEMSGRQLFNKLILAKAYKDSDERDKLNKVENTHKELYKYLKAEDLKKFEKYNQPFCKGVKEAKEFIEKQLEDDGTFKLYEAQGLKQDQIIEIMKRESKGTLVLIDYIQRVPAKEGEGYDSFMRLKKISDNLVKASIEAGLVTICGAQFNRVAGKNEDGDDTFTDNSFRESGDIEQDAHNAIGIGWRKDKKKRFYEVLKARESGHTGKKFYLEFNGAYSFMERGDKKENKGKKRERIDTKPGDIIIKK